MAWGRAMLFHFREVGSQLFHTKGKVFWGTILFFVCLAMLMAGLWPFEFHPVNKVEWLQDRDGVHFYGQGMIVSPRLWDESQGSPFQDRAITIEIWVRPDEELSDVGIGRLVSFYDGKQPDLLFLGQWRTHLDIQARLRTIRGRFERPTKNKDYQEAGLLEVLSGRHERFITVTSGAGGTLIYADGSLEKTYPRHNMLAGFTGTPFQLIIGNSSHGESYWTGYLSGLAIYNRMLTPGQVFSSYKQWMDGGIFSQEDNGRIDLYLFDERKGPTVHNKKSDANHLRIPEVFAPLQRVFLSDPWNDFYWSSSYFEDLAINIVGFMPFGFFCTAFLLSIHRLKKNDVFFIVALLGFAFSLSIELIQAYIPTRHSQLHDVICNFVGTIMGVLIFHRAIVVSPNNTRN
jgi:hypothetical protein